MNNYNFKRRRVNNLKAARTVRIPSSKKYISLTLDNGKVLNKYILEYGCIFQLITTKLLILVVTQVELVFNLAQVC